MNIPQRYALLAHFSLVSSFEEAEIMPQCTLFDNFDRCVEMRRHRETNEGIPYLYRIALGRRALRRQCCSTLLSVAAPPRMSEGDVL